MLEAIALEDPDASVRLTAAKAAEDDGVLVKVAMRDADQATRVTAVESITSEEALFQVATRKAEIDTDLFGDQFVEHACQDTALAKLTDDTLIARVAMTAKEKTSRKLRSIG